MEATNASVDPSSKEDIGCAPIRIKALAQMSTLVSAIVKGGNKSPQYHYESNAVVTVEDVVRVVVGVVDVVALVVGLVDVVSEVVGVVDVEGVVVGVDDEV